MIARNPRSMSDLRDGVDSLSLGWHHSEQIPFGFAPVVSKRAGEPLPLFYDGDGHLLTFAPTGGGKGRSVAIPTLLTCNRPIIALDVKGELFQVTARRRREMGHRVIVIDPFGEVTSRSDGLNPFDLLTLPGVDVDTEAETLATLLTLGNVSTRERFWDIHGSGLLAGLIAHVATTAAPKDRHILTVRDLMMGEDPLYQLAALMDGKRVVSPLARREFASFLNQAERDTRPSVLATTTSYVKPLGSNQIGPAVAQSTFALEELISGRPLTVYVVIPPQKLESHKGLVRLLMGTLIGAILRRRHAPEQRTLLLLDEAAQLGKFELLKSAVTLCRGYGLQVWAYFQSLHQLKETYPDDWLTFLDNTAVVQTFRFGNPWMANHWEGFFDRPAAELLSLPPDDQLLYLPGQGVVQTQRFDYLKDPVFRGLFDSNQRFLRPGEVEPRGTCPSHPEDNGGDDTNPDDLKPGKRRKGRPPSEGK